MVDTRLIRLRDGRDLAWQELGDENGSPIFAFHGTPGSRLAFGPDDPRLRAAGARLICPDRPGYGLSAFQPGRRLTDWPDDVSALADHLDLDRFAVLGVSGGGPHSAVCAALLPARITRAAIVSGVACLADPDAAEGMMAMNKINTALGRHAPVVLRPLFGVAMGAMRRFPERAMAGMLKRVPPSDRDVLQRPEVRSIFEDEFAHMSATSGRAAAQDFALFARDWGFALADIKVPVRIWQGDADVNVPAAHARRQHEAIPGSTLTECPGEGHLLVFDHLDEILGYLAA